jgi:hypothetical protein
MYKETELIKKGWIATKHKTFKIGKAFYLYRTDGLFWFRFFGCYGLHGKDFEKHPLMFGERYGYRKKFKFRKWAFGFLKPYK